MDVNEIIDFRKDESEKRSYLREQIRVVYGNLRFTGTNDSATDTPFLPFGVARFMEKPNITIGFEIISGTVTNVQLPPIGWRMDTKGLYEAIKFRAIIDADGDFEINVNYQLQGKCHLTYEKEESWN